MVSETGLVVNVAVPDRTVKAGGQEKPPGLGGPPWGGGLMAWGDLTAIRGCQWPGRCASGGAVTVETPAADVRPQIGARKERRGRHAGRPVMTGMGVPNGAF